MKKTNRLLALLLSCMMLIGTLAVPTMAEGTVTNPTTTAGNTLSEDFETTTYYGYYVSEISTKISLKLETEGENTYQAFSSNIADSEVGTSTANQGTSYYMYCNGLNGADTYKVTGKFRYDDDDSISTVDTNRYIGFRFNPTGSDPNNVVRVFNMSNNSPAVAQVANGAYVTLSDGEIQLEKNVWYSFTIEKTDSTTVVVTMAGNGTTASRTMTFNAMQNNTTPAFEFKADERGGSIGEDAIHFDDIQLTKTVSGVSTAYPTQDFENGTAEGTLRTFGDDFDLEVLGTCVADVIEDPTNAENTCFRFSDNGIQTSLGKHRVYLTPSNFASANYTVSGKLYIEGMNAGFAGFYFEPIAKQTSKNIGFMSYPSECRKLTNSSGMDDNMRWGLVQVMESDVRKAYKSEAFCANTWVRFEITRSGNTVSATVWTGDAKPTTPTVTYTYSDLGTEAETPCFDFVGAAKNLNVCIDDLTITDNTAASTPMSLVGVQGSTAVTNGAYAVRFLGGMNLDATTCKEAGFTVVAKFVDSTTNSVVTDTYSTNECAAYTSVISSSTTGVSATVTAAELKSQYLTAMSIYNIPSTVTTVVFMVDAYVIDGNDTQHDAATGYVKATVSGTTVNVEWVTADVYNNFGA